MRKFIILGLDGAIPGIVEEYAKKSYLNNFDRLMNKGVFGIHLPFPSAVTTVNWLSVATGAYPGTTGVSDFTVHIPGKPFIGKGEDAFSSEQCLAELSWDAFSRQGFKVATISYPGAHPRSADNHTAIGDSGRPTENSLKHMLSPAKLYVTGDLNPVGPYDWKEYNRVKLESPSSWRNLPNEYNPQKETQITVEAINPRTQGTYRLKVLLGRQEQKKIAIFSPTKDYGERIAEVSLNEWSDWLEYDFVSRGETIKAVFRFHLTEFFEDSLQLYISPVYPKMSFTEPEGYGKLLYRSLGPYCDSLKISNLVMNWLPPERVLDEFEMQGVWQAKAALELVNNQGHLGIFSKWHGFDKFYHKFFDKIDPISPHYDLNKYEHFERIHRHLLQIADKMVGIVMDGMDDETTLFVLSDHGLMPTRKFAWVNNYLAENGYINIDSTGKINWRETKAIMHPWTTIWINLQGRDPQGCVPQRQYKKVCKEIIHLLKGWQDPETHQYIMDEVFMPTQNSLYGLWGNRDGDVRFFTNPGFTVYRSKDLTEDRRLLTKVNGPYKGDHGSSKPNASFGRGSEYGLFAAMGRGIRENYRRKKPVKPCDIIPTICKISGIKPPKDCEGAILYDVLTSEFI